MQRNSYRGARGNQYSQAGRVHCDQWKIEQCTHIGAQQRAFGHQIGFLILARAYASCFQNLDQWRSSYDASRFIRGEQGLPECRLAATSNYV